MHYVIDDDRNFYRPGRAYRFSDGHHYLCTEAYGSSRYGGRAEFRRLGLIERLWRWWDRLTGDGTAHAIAVNGESTPLN